MARLKINIPNDKVPLVLAAYGRPGQSATPEEVRQEIISEIKKKVKDYQMMRLRVGQVNSISQAELTVDVTGED